MDEQQAPKKLTLDERIKRFKELMKRKEDLDGDFAALFEGTVSRRGRPPKPEKAAALVSAE